METYELGLRILMDYIYDNKPIQFEALSPELLDYIQGFRPRLPADEFPEDFPDESGYTGNYFTLYRGLCFTDPSDYENFISNWNGVYNASVLSAWTRNPSVALRFAKGASLFDDDRKLFYRGVILEIKRVEVTDTFFSSYEAHCELEHVFEERMKTIENSKQHSLHEEEIVLLPGKYACEIYEQVGINSKVL